MTDAINKQQVIDQINALTVDGEFSQSDVNYLINYLIANGDLTGSPRDMIQIRRGNLANLPNLAQGELAVTLDTEDLYVGGVNGNVLISSTAIDTINVKKPPKPLVAAKGDGVADDAPAIQAIFDYIKANSLKVKVVFPTGTYRINTDLIMDTMHDVDLIGSGSMWSSDNVTDAGTKFMYYGTSHMLKIIKSTNINIYNILFDGNDNAQVGILCDRLQQSKWENVGVWRVMQIGWLLTSRETTIPNNNTLFNTFINVKVQSNGIAMQIGEDIVPTPLGNVCHNVFINTTLNYSGDAGIEFKVCDNNSFYQTFIYRKLGAGVGVRFPNNNLASQEYFYHLQSDGGLWVQDGCQYAGVVFGYDMSNGQPLPLMAKSTQLFYTTNGLNAVGWGTPLINVHAKNNAFSATYNDGFTVKDILNLGFRLWGTGGNSTKWVHNDADRSLIQYFNADGSSDVEVSRQYGNRRLDKKAIVYQPKVINVNTSTPDVSDCYLLDLFFTGATDVTNFVNGYPGQIIVVLWTGYATFKNNASLSLKGGVDWLPTRWGSTLTLRNRDGVWFEVARTD